MSLTYDAVSMRWVIAAGLVLAIVGCTKHNPAATCPDGTCSDPAHPFCDADGAISGEPGACIAVSCTPGQFQACDGNNELVCDSSGSNYQAMACSDGCDSASGCHVPHIEPVYLPDICDAPATMSTLEISSSGILDPNLDVNCSGGVVDQTGAPSICVVRAATIKIDSGITLKVVNEPQGGGRLIAFVADTDLEVAGTLDVSAHGSINGPGGGATTSGGYLSCDGEGGGGGGAGAQTVGGDGGDYAGGDGGCKNGGAESPAILPALFGGPSAVQDVNSDTNQDEGGGGGGGGMALISCLGTVSVSGTLSAGGGGANYPLLFDPGFAGGAGGNVVLQGINVVVTGQAFANGGGGGGGIAAGMYSPAGAGGDALLSDTQAAPGGAGTNGGGSGGFGGVGMKLPGDGAKPTCTTCGGGGGGGSVGFLQTYTPAGVTPTLTPTAVSPPFQPNGTVPTK